MAGAIDELLRELREETDRPLQARLVYIYIHIYIYIHEYIYIYRTWAIDVLLRELREDTDGPPQARLIYICVYISGFTRNVCMDVCMNVWM